MLMIVIIICRSMEYQGYDHNMIKKASKQCNKQDIYDEKLTKDQAGFRHGRSCAGQLLTLTQHIEDGYKRKMLTDGAF